MLTPRERGWKDNIHRIPSKTSLGTQEMVERLKPHGLHGEEVDANDAFGLVAQKAPPGLRILLQGCGSNPLQISRDSTLAHSVSQEEQLPMDPGRAPRWILGRHPTDEGPDLLLGSRSTSARLPGPEEPIRFPMPANHRCRLHQDQCVDPAVPSTQSEGP